MSPTFHTSDAATLDPTKLPAPWPSTATTSTLYVSASIFIPVPASTAFQILADPSKYKDWNSFIPQAEHHPASRSDDTKDAQEGDVQSLTALREGDEVVLHARMKPSDSNLHKSPLKVKRLALFPGDADPAGKGDPGFDELPDGQKTYRLEWGSDGFTLRAHRVMEVREVPAPSGETGDWCEFRTWEMMNGPLAYVVRGMFGGTLQERFFDWAKDLRGECVKQQGAGRT